jgi:hypothetical protein
MQGKIADMGAREGGYLFLYEVALLNGFANGI